MIKLTAIGHIGKDSVVNMVNGRSAINFNVASTEKWKDAQGTGVEKTTWMSCSYWPEKTGIAQYLKKGTQVYIEGTVEARVYNNDRGESVPQLQVKVFTVQLLGGKKEDNQQPSQNSQPSSFAGNDMEETPF
jgi:single-strand DNA-binding protein